MSICPLPEAIYDYLNQPNALLLHTSRVDENNYHSYLFTEPKDIIAVYTFADLEQAFQKIDDALKKGDYAAGYVAYEAGFYFNPKLQHAISDKKQRSPLLWFGIYSAPYVFDHLNKQSNRSLPAFSEKNIPRQKDCHASNFQLSISKPDYLNQIQAIKAHIRNGNIYQLNFTSKLEFDFKGNPAAFYRRLSEAQPVSYGAYLNCGSMQILSLSPELFFHKKGQHIQTHPMKGTAPRGRTAHEDKAMKAWLKTDEKNRAENLMIVDLLRNDLGRICLPHSIRVKKLFDVQTYPSLHQMISVIEGKLCDNLSTKQLFETLFPCGSVTGAPKIKAMELIDKFEASKRGVYTGSIGFLSPHGEAAFNVAIRTITIKSKKGRMGVGSGIVWDSDPKSEYRECELKAHFLNRHPQHVQLIETMLWQEGYPLLSLHLQRLMHSASVLNFECCRKEIQKLLHQEARAFQTKNAYKVRLLLNKDGSISIESSKLGNQQWSDPKVCLAKTPMHSQNPYLAHKTTCRDVYNELHAKALRFGFADVLFFNENGNLTEGAISNVFLKKNNQFFTPELSCGLLPGVYREKMLEDHAQCLETKLRIDDVTACDELYICNAVRGLVRVTFEHVYIEDL